MATTTATLIAGLLKRKYTSGVIADMCARKNPAITIVSKDTCGGEYTVQPLNYVNGANASFTFSTSQTYGGGPKVTKFLIPGKTIHDVVNVDNEVIRATRGNAVAFEKAIDFAAKRGMTSMMNKLGTFFFGSGSGTLGTYSAISTGVITLSDPSSVSKFDIDQVLQSSSSETAAAVSALGYVIAKDVGAGTITISDSAGGSAATPSGWSTSYPYLFQYGDFHHGVPGVAGFIPSTAPSVSESFLGIDRSVDSNLSGIRYSGAGLPIKEALTNCIEILTSNGANPDYIFVNPRDWSAFDNQLGDAVRYTEVKGTANVGWTAITVSGSGGVVKVVGDRNVPLHTGYPLQTDTWTFYSASGSDLVVAGDPMGQMTHLRDAADQTEIRLACELACVGCSAPGWNAVITNLGN